MRRRFVIALAFLSVALTGGTCEFRAVSNNPIPDEPPEGESNNPETGLLILVNAGASNAITDTATIDASIIQTALATSVLSIPSRTPTASADSSMPELGSEQVLEISTVQANPSRSAHAIPEPGGFYLYGLGTIVLSWRLRRRTRLP